MVNGQVLENSLMNVKLFSTPNVLRFISQKDGFHSYVRASCDVPKCNVNDVYTWKIGIVKNPNNETIDTLIDRDHFYWNRRVYLVLLGISHPSHLISNKMIIINQKSKDDATFK